MNFSGAPDVVADLVTVYRAGVPGDIASDRRSLDEAYATAAVFSAVEGTLADWDRACRIMTSSGVALDAIARDHGLSRQVGESDDALRARLRVPPSAGTASAIAAALQPIVDAGGGGQIFLVQLPRDGAFFARCRLSMKSSIQRSSTGSAFLGRGKRMSGGPVRMVVALIPASADCLSSATDALRSKVSAAKAYLVQEYTP